MKAAIAGSQNILISGGTSTGKTTLLNALAAFLPPNAIASTLGGMVARLQTSE